MTTRDKIELEALLAIFNNHIDCNKNCSICDYSVNYNTYSDCPIALARELVYDSIYKIDEWNRRKG